MALAPGTRVGAFEITGPIGAGGMGEVYRARDTRLNRDVALKVLPPTLAIDPERRARLHREAQVLAALNHPNIAQVHGLEETPASDTVQPGVSALIMELVEGEDLSVRSARGPIAWHEARRLALQIVIALEAAHEAGIVHRDLKPANIKVRDDGTVKVLDFGLAKTIASATAGTGVDLAGGAAEASPADSPTMTTPAVTQAGIILGTAAYMSPEQAKGRLVDKRTDVWAFGCVLYEMLTGARAFAGDDVSDTLAAILRADPDWSRLPADVPEPVRQLLANCLERDRHTRVPDMAVPRYVLEGRLGAADTSAAGSRAGAVAPPRRRLSVGLAVAIAFGLGIASALALVSSGADANDLDPAAVLRFALPLPADVPLRGGQTVSIAPDGSRVVLVAGGDEGTSLWLRSLASSEATKLGGTDGATAPFWSPDSREVGFLGDAKLKVVTLETGTVQALANAPSPRGGTWQNDTILFVPDIGGPLAAVRRSGGQPQLLEHTRALVPGFPWALPDGDHFLFLSEAKDRETRVVHVGSRTASDLIPLHTIRTGAIYAEPGYLMFVRGDTLFAQRFDLAKLALEGEMIAIETGISSSGALGPSATVSTTGALAYRQGPPTSLRRMTWFDAKGDETGTIGPPDYLSSFRLSPDQQRAVLDRVDQETGDREIWLIDDVRIGAATRLGSSPVGPPLPAWWPDSSSLVFQTGEGFVRRDLGGNDMGPLIPGNGRPLDVSPDGRFLLAEVASEGTGLDLAILRTDGSEPVQWLPRTPFNEGKGRISPDGRWVAYASDESGRQEIYLQPFPEGGQKRRITTGGAFWPRWRHDGRELFFVTGTRQLAAVSLDADGRVSAAGTRRLATAAIASGAGGLATVDPFEMSPNGDRFLIFPRPTTGIAAVLMNWPTLLRAQNPDR